MFSENVIHVILEYCGGIGEAKGHYPVLEHAVVFSEGSLPFLSFLDAEEVVGPVVI